MALLKAFVCQVVLFGLYKLFLEQVVEKHLVPDELTRNSLVVFVCLLCFGIQVYTDKAGEDDAEAEEDPTVKSKLGEPTAARKFESAAASVIHEILTEAVGSNAPRHVMITKTQTTSNDLATEKERSSKNQQVVVTKEESNEIPATEYEKVTNISHSGIFGEYSTNVPDRIGMTASTEQTYNQETKILPVLNGLSEIMATEESDEEGIVIDHFVSKEAEKLITVEVETTNLEHEAEVATESDCSTSNGVNISSMQDLDSGQMIDEYESRITNGTVTESLNNIGEIPIEKNESKTSVKNENEIVDEREIASKGTSEPEARTKDIAESLQSAEEMDRTSTVSTKTVNEAETVNKICVEASSMMTATVVSPRREITEECVYATPLSIDISFIYACF